MDKKKVVQFYKKEEIETAPKHKLLSLLHKKCLFLLKESILEESLLNRRLLLNRVQNILSFLEQSLNFSDETAFSLFYLYDYCYTLLENNDNINVIKAKEVLSILCSVWDSDKN